MRRVSRCAALLLLGILAWPLNAPAADSLGSVRSAVRTQVPDPPREPEQPRQPSHEHECHDPHCPDDNEGSAEFWGAALIGTAFVITAPYWGPNALVERDELGVPFFAAAPYEGSVGSMVHGPMTGECPADAYCWATRVRTEYLDDFESLTGYRGHLLFEHSNRWGFDGELNYWQESLASGSHDELWTGDANVLFRFAQNERVQMRSGLGMAWLHDNIGTDLGFNFTYGGDIYPIQPLVISADLDAGWIGEAWFLHLRSTVGLQWKQVEVFTGYDYLEIGNAQLDGLVAGVRVLF